MQDPQDDRRVLDHVQRLVSEEHRLFEQKSLGEQDQAKLKRLQVELDQCWDLLRQRRAARETGRDPAEAQARPPDVVERYTG
jgi:hypothetical protein